MNYAEKCKQIIDQLVDREFKATQAWIMLNIQAPSHDELNRLAFDNVVKDMKKAEQEAGLGVSD